MFNQAIVRTLWPPGRLAHRPSPLRVLGLVRDDRVDGLEAGWRSIRLDDTFADLIALDAS